MNAADTFDPSPLVWQDGQPRSRLFGDIYYSLEDGLAESRAVFLKGCGMPGVWAGRRRFTVAELGFGTGLNIVALLDLWRRTRPADAHLHIFSIEGFPVTREEAALALGAWPEIAEAAQALLSRWPGARRGMQRVDLPEFSATLDLAIMDVEPALAGWAGQADAWFLDGFSPALNPAMWSDEILARIGAGSAPGAVAATFTVAGQVRRGLTAAGFDVAKAPGHGRKRERLEARMPGAPSSATTDPRLVIIGGGIAGASLARALIAYGVAAQVVASGAQTAASGNRAALVMPALDAGGGPRAALYAQAFARAVQIYDELPDAVLAQGAMQVEASVRDAARFDTVAGQDIFEPGSLERLSPEDAALALEEEASPGSIAFRDARVVDPSRILSAWIGEAAVEGEALRIDAIEQGWRIQLADGRMIDADVVIVAAGWGASALHPDLPLSPVRGQVSFCAHEQPIAASACGSYAIPARGGVLFGATHDRGETATDESAEDNLRNRAGLAAVRPALAAALEASAAEGRASIRATTPDRMPLAGPVAPGLFVLSGLGSRGFTTAPLLAEHIAALVLGSPSPLSSHLAALVSPRRFHEAK